MLESLYNRLPPQLRPLAKSVYLSMSSRPKLQKQKQIGHAVSDDLRTWERDPQNPVFTTPDDSRAWDGVTVEDPDIVYENGEFVMFYAGHSEYDWETKQIGVARSDDGVSWTRNSTNPILSPNPKSWHSRSVQNPAVVSHDGSYQMVFDGSKDSHGWVGLGHATADAVDDWRESSQSPIVSIADAEPWRRDHIGDPTVVHNDGTYHLYYAGATDVSNDGEWKIGYATTSDFTTIEHHSENPILSNDGRLSIYKHVQDPNVIHDGEQFHMIFAANTGSVKQFEYASSKDGAEWQIHHEPVLVPDESADWEGTRLTSPGLAYDGEKYHLFYTGVSNQ